MARKKSTNGRKNRRPSESASPSQRNPQMNGPPYIRPWSTLSALPLSLRWEVTRRHGYYVSFWEYASKFDEVLTNGVPTEIERDSFRTAQAILWCIGYSGPPISPATAVEKLDTNPFDSQMQGATQPLTLRALFRLLLMNLSHVEQNLIGSFMRSPFDPEEDGESPMVYALRFSNGPNLEWLDRLAPGLHISIDPYAPTQAILDEVKQAVSEQKKQLCIRETRRRHEDIPKYLQVWDLREGWHEGAYHGDREQTLKAIARQLARPLSTVASQYRSAFQAITGIPYDPYIWLRVFGVLKLSRIYGSTTDAPRSLSRMLTGLMKEQENETNVSDDPVEATDNQELDDDAMILAEQIQQMLNNDSSTADIQEKLGLQSGRLIEYFRQRLTEGLM